MTATPPFDPIFLRLQTLLAGRFSLERELGRGGMGIVYLARDIALERPVAIKLLAPELSARPEMRARFLREARIAAQCFHPHIVPIHAVEEADGLAWIVMTYVRGETVAQRLQRNGPMPAEEVRRLAREVGWALSYAHQRGVVHRDIKPENLLIDGSTERFVIADFGIAQMPSQPVTPVVGTAVVGTAVVGTAVVGTAVVGTAVVGTAVVGTAVVGTAVVGENGSPVSAAIGTARYMSPEQALGEPLDGRADLYSLGVTLFLAATGRTPFMADTSHALMVQHASIPAPSVQQYAPGLPLALVRAIDRCLAKLPEDRFADAGRFLTAIEPDVRLNQESSVMAGLREHAGAARTMFAWFLVTAVTTQLLVAGEQTGSLGRSVFLSIGNAVMMLFAAASILRSIEAAIEMRRLHKRGHDASDVAGALSGADRAPVESTGVFRGLGAGVAQLSAGIALALGQGVLTSVIPQSFSTVSQFVQIVAVFLPPMMIARGSRNISRNTHIGSWLQQHITHPLARLASRTMRFGLRAAPATPVLDSAPTEVLLVRAVESLLHDLPAAHRATVGTADQVARDLATKIRALRAHLGRVDAMETKALEIRDPLQQPAALARVRVEREDVQAKLHASMTALESLRLDVLRLSVEPHTHGGISGVTTKLEAAYHVHRHVDAAIEVRRLLKEPTPV